ncbi:YbjN domain-containing protein [Prescottella defluvii]|uniref:T3SS (YopN, CesT) and YbjN peptide-binding chaperone 1 n=1 Tax=Prescottella defluvii TaxID=1323361 RepID=UPI0004F334AD|nr:hypothetical protein [Prescottella defluvii]
MSESADRSAAGDFDREVAGAWAVFRSSLADRIAAISSDDQVILETVCDTDEADGRVPFLQFTAGAGPDGTVVRCELPADVHLPPRRRLTPAEESRLLAQGWARPVSPEGDPELDMGDVPALVVEKTTRWADQLASMAVSMLRETWDVPHPAFLVLHHLGDDAEPAADPAVTPVRTPLDRHVSIRPRDTAHLREAIAHTLTDIYGQAPELDADGDVVLRFGSALALVIANESTPEVQLWAPLVRDISGRTRASELITDLNRRWPYLRFALFEDRLRVMIDMLADPFVPQHLADMVEHLSDFLGGVDEEFANHFGGVLHFPAAEPATAPETTPTADTVPDAFVPEPEPANPPEQMDQMELFDDPVQPSLFDDLDDQ